MVVNYSPIQNSGSYLSEGGKAEVGTIPGGKIHQEDAVVNFRNTRRPISDDSANGIGEYGSNAYQNGKWTDASICAQFRYDSSNDALLLNKKISKDTTQEIMKVDKNGLVTFGTSVNFSGGSSVINTLTTSIQDQQLEIGVSESFTITSVDSLLYSFVPLENAATVTTGTDDVKKIVSCAFPTDTEKFSTWKSVLKNLINSMPVSGDSITDGTIIEEINSTDGTVNSIPAHSLKLSEVAKSAGTNTLNFSPPTDVTVEKATYERPAGGTKHGLIILNKSVKGLRKGMKVTNTTPSGGDVDFVFDNDTIIQNADYLGNHLHVMIVREGGGDLPQSQRKLEHGESPHLKLNFEPVHPTNSSINLTRTGNITTGAKNKITSVDKISELSVGMHVKDVGGKIKPHTTIKEISGSDIILSKEADITTTNLTGHTFEFGTFYKYRFHHNDIDTVRVGNHWTFDQTDNSWSTSLDHNLSVGEEVKFTHAGTAPSSYLKEKSYYVKEIPDAKKIKLSESKGGSVLAGSGFSKNWFLEKLSATLIGGNWKFNKANANLSVGGDWVYNDTTKTWTTSTVNGLHINDQIKFSNLGTTGNGYDTTTIYYVRAIHNQTQLELASVSVDSSSTSQVNSSGDIGTSTAYLVDTEFTDDKLSNVWTSTTNHGLFIGDKLEFFTTEETVNTGYNLSTVYYVVKVPTTTTLQLSSTKNGTVIAGNNSSTTSNDGTTVKYYTAFKTKQYAAGDIVYFQNVRKNNGDSITPDLRNGCKISSVPAPTASSFTIEEVNEEFITQDFEGDPVAHKFVVGKLEKITPNTGMHILGLDDNNSLASAVIAFSKDETKPKLNIQNNDGNISINAPNNQKIVINDSVALGDSDGNSNGKGNVDFQIKSKNEEAMFYMDADKDRIGVGNFTSSSGNEIEALGATLHIKNQADADHSTHHVGASKGAGGDSLVKLENKDADEITLEISADNDSADVIKSTGSAKTTATELNIKDRSNNLTTGGFIRSSHIASAAGSDISSQGEKLKGKIDKDNDKKITNMTTTNIYKGYVITGTGMGTSNFVVDVVEADNEQGNLTIQTANTLYNAIKDVSINDIEIALHGTISDASGSDSLGGSHTNKSTKEIKHITTDGMKIGDAITGTGILPGTVITGIKTHGQTDPQIPKNDVGSGIITISKNATPGTIRDIKLPNNLNSLSSKRKGTSRKDNYNLLSLSRDTEATGTYTSSGTVLKIENIVTNTNLSDDVNGTEIIMGSGNETEGTTLGKGSALKILHNNKENHHTLDIKDLGTTGTTCRMKTQNLTSGTDLSISDTSKTLNTGSLINAKHEIKAQDLADISLKGTDSLKGTLLKKTGSNRKVISNITTTNIWPGYNFSSSSLGISNDTIDSIDVNGDNQDGQITLTTGLTGIDSDTDTSDIRVFLTGKINNHSQWLGNKNTTVYFIEEITTNDIRVGDSLTGTGIPDGTIVTGIVVPSTDKNNGRINIGTNSGQDFTTWENALSSKDGQIINDLKLPNNMGSIVSRREETKASKGAINDENYNLFLLSRETTLSGSYSSGKDYKTTGSVLKIENVVGKVTSDETLTDHVNGAEIIMSGGGNTASDQMQAGKNGTDSTGNGNVHGKGCALKITHNNKAHHNTIDITDLGTTGKTMNLTALNLTTTGKLLNTTTILSGLETDLATTNTTGRFENDASKDLRTVNLDMKLTGKKNYNAQGIFMNYQKFDNIDANQQQDIRGMEINVIDSVADSKADGGGELSNATTANINLYGLDISSTGAGYETTTGKTVTTGAQLNSSKGVGNIGLQINCNNKLNAHTWGYANGGVAQDCCDLKITSCVSDDTPFKKIGNITMNGTDMKNTTGTDYFGIKVDANGMTRMRAVDGGFTGESSGTNQNGTTHNVLDYKANMFLEAHGDITLNAFADGNGTTHIETNTNGTTIRQANHRANVRLRHDDIQFVRFESIPITSGYSVGKKDCRLFIGNYKDPSNVSNHELGPRAEGTPCLHFQPQSSTVCDINCTGNISCNSDIKLKENIVPLEKSLDKVNKLKGVTFDWKSDDRKKTNIGFIAQQVEEVIPELVNTDDSGIKSVSYTQMVAVLTEAMKEQQKMIDSQQKIIESLQKDMAELKK